MNTCTTCRMSNELYKDAQDQCGDCIEDSTNNVEFPRYVRSLAWKDEDNNGDNQ